MNDQMSVGVRSYYGFLFERIKKRDAWIQEYININY
jgi:hypothetical protein